MRHIGISLCGRWHCKLQSQFVGLLGQVTALTAPLTETKAFKLSQVPNQCGLADGLTPGTKRKGKAKGKAQALPPNAPMDATVNLEGGHVRTAMFADDFINSINWSLQNVDSADIDEATVDQALLTCCEFGLVGKILLQIGKAARSCPIR